MKALTIIVFALATIQMAGCATVMNSPNQRIPVSSDPTGADVYVDGQHKGKTPVTLRLARGRDHTIVVEWSGRQREFMLSSTTGGATGWTAGNIIVGGLIGFGVDAVTGSLYELHPSEIHADFGHSSPVQPAHAPAVHAGAMRSLAPPPAPPPPSNERTAAMQLEEIERLREKGLLSKEEYERMRAIFLRELERGN